ncbi:MAG: FAD:protein FMN transferase [Nitrospirales bacterium]|nr:FAD:protein FMN transferase [Nitrospira sp.]MDR4500176.1 FAD:protein FMN transferase [Nitrospirales bacterium]
MGTTYSVTIVDPLSSLSRETTLAATDQILDRINLSMSTYRPDSELSKFNQNQTTQWVPISADLYEVMKEALRVSRLSGGAFDISVAPLVDLWGFGPSSREDTIPSDADVQARLKLTGYTHLYLQENPRAMRKDLPSLSVDLSAIAKGYAVDQVVSYLDSLNLSDYLVEIGGELRAKGNNAQGHPWNVAIEQPNSKVRTVHRVVHLENQAVATSGDYRNFFERGGVKFSHTINPNTGRPITHNLTSVTVIAESCMKADALATAFLVLGPEAGYALARREQVASLFISTNDDGYLERATPAIQAHLGTGKETA